MRRVRSLPGGRAVVGALLVTAAAVGTFVAYLTATAAPTTAFLVATEAIAPGTRFTSGEQLRSVMGGVTVELVGPLDDRAIPVEEIDTLVGSVLVAPLERGDLVSRTAVVDDGGVAPAQTLSLLLPRTDAVGGTLRPGERIDVLATHGSGDGAYTAYVLRGVPLLQITAPDGSPVGDAAELALTVAVTELADVQALGHAVNTAEVFVTRSTAGPGDLERTPGPFRADPQAPGPAPDPATIGSSVPKTEVEPSAEAQDAGGAGSGGEVG